MGYSVKVTEHAHDDLDQIVSYIVGELGNPSAALSLLAAVEGVYEKLMEAEADIEEGRVLEGSASLRRLREKYGL